MHILCDGCGAKYAIRDDKVSGRIFRVRCKKCGEAIVARGSPLAPAVETVAPPAVGARNEGSVLFSLENLRALGARTPAPADTAEGSGLIDIRAIAASNGTATSGRPNADDLLVFGGVAAAPLVATTARAPDRRLLVAAVAASSALAVIATGFAAIVLTWMPAGRAGTTVGRPALPAPAAPPPAIAPPPAAAPQVAPIPSAPPKARRSPPRPRPPANIPAHEPDRVAPSANVRGNVEEILAEALGPRPTPAAPDSAAVDLPQVPERPAVLAALGAMTSAVRRCAGGATGDAVVRYAFSGRGTVTAAQVVGGSFAGASAAECMAAAARGARVPPFRREALTVEFPYVIR